MREVERKQGWDGGWVGMWGGREREGEKGLCPFGSG
jgi:hypothetical protein